MELLQITPTALYIYNPPENKSKKSKDKQPSERVLEKDRDRVISSKTKRIIRNRLLTFFTCRPNKTASFFTLTLTSKQLFPDDFYNKKLNVLFTSLRKLSQRKLEYLWIAEKQGNGNIHYHIIFNQFIKVSKVNELWCNILRKIGHNVKDNANPVDVKRINSIRSLASYLTKYITKNKTSLKCQLWNCSKMFSNIDYKIVVPYISSKVHHFYQETIKRNFLTYNSKTLKPDPIDICIDDGRKIGVYLPIINFDAIKPFVSKRLIAQNLNLN